MLLCIFQSAFDLNKFQRRKKCGLFIFQLLFIQSKVLTVKDSYSYMNC